MRVVDKIVTVLGAGRSGISAAILLAKHEARVRISEMNKNLKTPDLLAIFNEHGIEYEFAHHSEQIFHSDFVILSPGIPTSSPIVRELNIRDIPVYSEIEVASWFSESPIIAVTGSNGKTTTTSLIADMLNRCGVDAVACGNIGHSFSQAVYTAIVSGTGTHPMYVTEISSFQLETTKDFKPNVAVILNITPDHLDRYDSFLDYALTKCRILINQEKEDVAVLNRDDEVINAHAKTRAYVIPVSKKKLPDSIAYFDGESFSFKLQDTWHHLEKKDIKLFGIHNEYNIASAASAVSPFIKNHQGVFTSLREFESIPHRIEFAGEAGNIRFYNDSKGTNIDAVKMAIQSFNSPLHLILGGRDKDSNFKELASYLSDKDSIYVIGEASKKIQQQLAAFSPLACYDMKTAVMAAFERAHPGDAVLFSPACASFDQYSDYAARGDHFKRIVKNIMGLGNESK
ncbi:MAG: UDP-N-acetylmuramoyl-L-alanine--D-glutamate ligase [Candidatus Marinimicrobia bacterium]|nr:UDP-N-acetylmuramoyl-L-alanine--D-glutamate ligase [Candidatus Neomarinimicrobiota bacterium]